MTAFAHCQGQNKVELDYRSRRSAGLGEKDVFLRVEDEKKDEDGGG